MNINYENTKTSEQALLGSILVNPDCLDDIEFLRPADFYMVRNRWIYEAAKDLRREGVGIDVLTLSRKLEARKQLDESGGVAYLTELVTATPNSYNAEHYARQIKQDALGRALLAEASEVARRAVGASQDAEINPATIAADAALVFGELAASDTSVKIKTPAVVLDTMYGRVEEYAKSRKLPGLSWHFRELNFLTGGRRRGRLVTIAGRPGMGKSSFAGQLALADAKKGLRVSVCTLEENAEVWMHHSVLGELQISQASITPEQLDLLRARCFDYENLPMRFYERGYCTIDELESNIKMHARELGGLDTIYIDHLGYVDHLKGKTGNLPYAIGVTTKRLARLAKELDCSVNLLCQLSRAGEVTQRKPTLTDLRDSGEIEQDSRMVVFIHRASARDAAEPTLPEETELIVAKNNEGGVGTSKVAYVRAYRHFLEIAKDDKPAPSQTRTNGNHQNGTAGKYRQAEPVGAHLPY
jgi:replicative DNA helicase